MAHRFSLIFIFLFRNCNAWIFFGSEEVFNIAIICAKKLNEKKIATREMRRIEKKIDRAIGLIEQSATRLLRTRENGNREIGRARISYYLEFPAKKTLTHTFVVIFLHTFIWLF